MGSSFKPNNAGIRKAYEQIAQNINRVDTDMRREYVGGDVDAIKREGAKRFASMKVQLPDSSLAEWAAAVRDGKPFQFHLS
jgi:hypothetical protein